MPQLPDSLIGRWRDRAFDLRGVSALYRHTVETLNTKTGAIARTNTDTSIIVLRSPASSSKTVDRTFRTRMCHLPDQTPRVGDRVVYDDIEYVITSWKTDQSEYVVDLICRRP